MVFKRVATKPPLGPFPPKTTSGLASLFMSVTTTNEEPLPVLGTLVSGWNVPFPFPLSSPI
jgi:hypothetical protein